MAIDMDDPRPAYVQLADQLKADIAAKKYAVDERVPGVRELAHECGVANATAARALNLLQQEGVVVSRPGVGTVVREPKPTTSGTIEDQLRDLRQRVEALEARYND